MEEELTGYSENRKHSKKSQSTAINKDEQEIKKKMKQFI